MPDGGGLAIQFGLTLGRVVDAQTRMCQQLDQLAAKQTALPNMIYLQNGAVVPAGGAAFAIDLGGPQQGRFWTVRGLGISAGDNVRTAIPGTTFCDWYVGKYSSIVSQVPPQEWVWTQSALPKIDPFSNEQVPVLPQQHLFCVVTGASTVGQQLLAQATILDVSQASYAATFNV